MNIQSFLDGDPRALKIPTFAEMQRRTDSLRTHAGVAVEQIGTDRFGTPIEMISIGEGATSILVVGAPHPNEPIGCIAIEWLIAQLCDDSGMRLDPGLRWHFIKSIEPYALKQNEGWFSQRDLPAYLHHFYRPALAQQAEYTFPSKVWQPPHHRSTVENLAYQRALQLARPDLLVSLHNAENAGAFYYLSREDMGLASALSRQAQARGLALNTCGEGLFGAKDTQLAPGVFFYPYSQPGPREAWPMAGVSVGDYLAENGHSTLVLVPEVPCLADVALAPGASMDEDLLIASLAIDRGIVESLTAVVSAIAEDASPLEALYAEAIQDSMIAAFELPWLEMLKGQTGPQEYRAQLLGCRILGLRPLAGIRRLAAMRAARPGSPALLKLAATAHLVAENHLAAAVAEPALRYGLRPVSLQLVVSNHLDAIFTAVARVRGHV
ncbi:hypothetical protein [Roseateles toxinivorans]|uniref:Zinc carboxypeptidase n=1 Tax=Roseateles toxinivorans TaxID=270368 RepID=A0A4R6QGE4_9BURK|nr:hypothetical protein [Roseateles toxinivorans]TDP62106.1 hypothetical protein DES47_10986 [Roseateles toxinivorans]